MILSTYKISGAGQVSIGGARPGFELAGRAVLPRVLIVPAAEASRLNPRPAVKDSRGDRRRSRRGLCI
jgi:hypothetical protein